MIRKRVLVAPASEFQARRRLFALLGELYSVEIEEWRPEAPASDAAIVWAGCREASDIAARRVDQLVFGGTSGTEIAADHCGVTFGDSDLLDDCFHKVTMVDECVGSISALPSRDGDEVIASAQGRPCWIGSRAGGVVKMAAALAPAEFAEGETVYNHFNRRCWLLLLPVLHFLKRLTGDGGWDPTPVRACLMFDDPNLHWPTYGFIDLRQLARHAREFNYHVCSAMVPLDAWFVNGSVAALFQEHRSHISLCMHGNDHAYREFGSPLHADEFTRMLAQGWRRIEGFEKRSGVEVSRIMVPPYGAFHENAAEPMLKLGYEAVCVSRASLTAWNKHKAWAPAFGHAMTEFLNGLPVIPRHVMAPGHDGAYRLAAFLGQPIIPHGHHQDCSTGYDLLERVAGSINALGNVVWSDMAALSRSNYRTRRTDETLVVRMLSRRISVPAMDGVKEILVERPWIPANAGHTEPLVCRAGTQTLFSGAIGRTSSAIALSIEGAVEIISPAPRPLNAAEVAGRGFQPWITARRVLSEARDRMAPLRPTRRNGNPANGVPHGK